MFRRQLSCSGAILQLLVGGKDHSSLHFPDDGMGILLYRFGGGFCRLCPYNQPFTPAGKDDSGILDFIDSFVGGKAPAALSVPVPGEKSRGALLLREREAAMEA